MSGILSSLLAPKYKNELQRSHWKIRRRFSWLWISSVKLGGGACFYHCDGNSLLRWENHMGKDSQYVFQSLDNQCPSKALCYLRLGCQPVALLGVGRNCRGRYCRRKLGYLRNTLEGEIGALVSFCLFLLPGYQGWRGVLHKSPSHHRPKAEQLRDCGQILKTLRQNKPLFFLNCYLKWLHRIHVKAFGVPQKTNVIHLGKQRQILSIKGQSNKRKDCVNKERATSDNSGDVGLRRDRGKRPGEKEECFILFGLLQTIIYTNIGFRTREATTLRGKRRNCQGSKKRVLFFD